mgnify:CR=1 FL=1
MFSDQIQRVVTDILDQLAPLRSRRPPRRVSRNLSAEAVTAKRRRRRLERRWKKYRREQDRLDCRSACRIANSLINKSRKDFYNNQFSASDPGARWKLAKTLLHSNDPVVNHSAPANLCDAFAKYFVDKIDLLRQSVPGSIHDYGNGIGYIL